MELFSDVATSMQDVLTTEADAIATEIDFIKRQRKFTGATFAQTLVFGWLANPDATLDELTQTAASLGLKISPQGLDQRFTQSSATFLREVLEASVSKVISGEPSAFEVLRRFNGVYLIDSSTVTLPDELAEVWEGCGGSSPQNTSSSLKLQVRWDLLSGSIGLELTDGRQSDKRSSFQDETLPQGCLRLTDLGFFSLTVLAEIGQSGNYWLTRVKSQCVFYVQSKEDCDDKCSSRRGYSVPRNDNNRYDLADFLREQKSDRVHINVLLGTKAKLPCRLIALRVPQQVANERRRKMKANAKKKGKTVSKRRLELANWLILATNASENMISFDEALVLARLRWQIELLFKLFKSKGKIDEWRTDKPDRILCEVYAKLIGMIVQHWMLLASGFCFGNKSLTKAARTIRQHIITVACAFAEVGCVRFQLLKDALKTIKQCIQFGCQMNTRKTNPNTYQLLLYLEQKA